MKEYFSEILPFIIIGISVLVIITSFNSKKDKKEKNYLSEGMSIGMCLGVTLSAALDINMGLGISLGMLIGESIGISIKK